MQRASVQHRSQSQARECYKHYSDGRFDKLRGFACNCTCVHVRGVYFRAPDLAERHTVVPGKLTAASRDICSLFHLRHLPEHEMADMNKQMQMMECIGVPSLSQLIPEIYEPCPALCILPPKSVNDQGAVVAVNYPLLLPLPCSPSEALPSELHPLMPVMTLVTIDAFEAARATSTLGSSWLAPCGRLSSCRLRFTVGGDVPTLAGKLLRASALSQCAAPFVPPPAWLLVAETASAPCILSREIPFEVLRYAQWRARRLGSMTLLPSFAKRIPAHTVPTTMAWVEADVSMILLGLALLLSSRGRPVAVGCRRLQFLRRTASSSTEIYRGFASRPES
ncbi:unnamed protein product [Symbiodinium natans]|uniref:Uncharacterized protein n=1 Tax=Symbiodinium natans TaxID=878477 RepID=A0A812KPS9_9DINO|nr:unnamed protein product [Symbiodinium natans]